MEFSHDSIKNIIDNNDLEALKSIPDDILNKYDYLLPYVVSLKWIDGIDEYVKRYIHWTL